jgi:hypothetical protein
MQELKQDKLIKETELIINNIEKVDADKIIKEAIDTSIKVGKKERLKDDKEEILGTLYKNTINNFLDYIKKNSIIESKEKLEKEIDENKRNIKAILIKAENEVKEYQSKYLNAMKENKNLQDKIYSLQKNNRELSEQVSTYETTLERLEKNYENISEIKSLFEEMIRSYPNKKPVEIIKELENMKEGTVQMLNDYHNISLKLNEAKENQKKLENEHKINMSKLTSEYKTIIEEKNSIDFKYYYKINSLEHQLSDNETKIKENQYLKNALFHIYNLLFKSFALNRNIIIDNKYLDIKESDFNPNFFYQKEINNYIELMIQTMHPNSYDLIFRETMGYINMILRLYLPNKMDLRFQPVKAFKEIKDFIDSKMRKIDENSKNIEKYKQEINNKDNEIFQIKQEMSLLNKEYNSYKKIVEKEFQKSNRIIFQLKNNKEKKDNNIYNIINSANSKRNKSFSDKINLSDSKFNLRNKHYKIKKRKAQTIRPSILKDILTNEKSSNKKIVNNNILGTKKYCKTMENLRNGNNNNNNVYNDFLKIRKSKNIDRFIKENGNQEMIDKLNNIKFLINETNRLFLYQPKMNSTQDKIYNKDKHSSLKKRVIREYKDLKVNEEDNIKKKIFKQINSIIVSSYK